MVSYFSIFSHTVTKEKEIYIQKDAKILDLINIVNEQFDKELNGDIQNFSL